MSLLVSAVVLTGCAKRPATTAAAAPAPTGSSGTSGTGSTGTGSGSQMQPGSGGATAQPGTGGATTPGVAGGSTGTQAPGSTARPAIRDFAADSNLGDIFFDFDKYDIRQADARTLDGNAQWLKSNPSHLVLIEGHCDERGTNEYNLALGERRAKSTMNYLVSQGVQANRITIISYGEERPTCTEKAEQCWAKNRRAHFLVKPR
ncbi:MAG: peptidoglycan-associated lipoprotein Pal [Candidatus Rokuibacteriota bacterium]